MKLLNGNLTVLGLIFLYSCIYGNIYAQERFVPVQNNTFVNVYQPKGDYFFGPDSKYLKEGKWYDKWVVNDHAILKGGDGRWHIIGITHPEILTKPLNKGIHHGEWASFHALSYTTDFKSTLEENHYDDLSKILTPKDRPGEILPNHAPHIIKIKGVYNMVYGHSPLR
jgi:beta-fructofuranosidase